jgi:hypothetical protein
MRKKKMKTIHAYSLIAGTLLAISTSGTAIATETTQSGEPVEATATGDVPTHYIFTGGPITFKRAVTDTLYRTTSSTKWIPLPGANPAGGATVPVAPGKSALINVRFTAESRCHELNAVANEINWCEVRVLIGGVEGEPADTGAISPYAFDATDSGTATFGDYEGHALERHRCYKNTGTTTVFLPVQVQWRVTNFNTTSGIPEFWLDDWSLAIERSDECTVRKLDPATLK